MGKTRWITKKPSLLLSCLQRAQCAKAHLITRKLSQIVEWRTNLTVSVSLIIINLKNRLIMLIQGLIWKSKLNRDQVGYIGLMRNMLLMKMMILVLIVKRIYRFDKSFLKRLISTPTEWTLIEASKHLKILMKVNFVNTCAAAAALEKFKSSHGHFSFAYITQAAAASVATKTKTWEKITTGQCLSLELETDFVTWREDKSITTPIQFLLWFN